MSEQQNVKTIQKVYAAFGRGDVAFIVDQLTDDIRWMSHFDPVVPWSGDFSGKERIPEAIFQSVDVDAFEPEWIADGDVVVSLGEFECRVRATGKRSRT
jgi:ketosteroid isomerase-like protein